MRKSMKYVLVLLVSILSAACTPHYVIQKSLTVVYNAVNTTDFNDTPVENCTFSFVQGDTEHNRLEIRRMVSERLFGNVSYVEAMEIADNVANKFKNDPESFRLAYSKYICGDKNGQN